GSETPRRRGILPRPLRRSDDVGRPNELRVVASSPRSSPGRSLSGRRAAAWGRLGTLSDKPRSVKADLPSGDPEGTLYTSDGKEPSPNEESGYIRDGDRPVSGHPSGGLGGPPDRHGPGVHGCRAEGPRGPRPAQGGPPGRRAEDRRRG